MSGPAAKRVALVGMPGVGKTEVGRRLAALRESGFVDLDEEIERSCGSRIEEIFARWGEERFRVIEEATLRQVLNREGDMVLATGGGVVEREANREILSERCFVIWLRAGPEVLAERIVRAESARPILGADPSSYESRLRELAAKRYPLYSGLADMVLDVDRDPPDLVAEAIAEVLRWRLGD